MIGRDRWLPARLIPTSGIGGPEEQERRATSALLAVLTAVPEFARSLLSCMRAPAGRVSTYIEVPLAGADERKLRPDGAIVIERGRTRWACLVEVKTGGNPLRDDQVDQYLALAREHGFDAVLTISNEIAAVPGELPVSVDGRRLRGRKLAHLSWWRILTEAIVQHEHRGVSDPDQAWILGELIAYLRHPRTGTGAFDDLGEHWVAVRNAARQNTLRRGKETASVVARWEEFTQYVCLGLCQELGREVTPVYRRGLTPAARRDATERELVENARLTATLRVPDAVGPITIEADLRARQVTTSVKVDAPGDGRPKTRVNWLLRQLNDAPGDLRVEAAFTGSRQTTSCLFDACREQPERLLLPGDDKRPPRRFTVAATRPMGSKRGRGDDSFVSVTQRQLIDFYRDLVQNLRPWAARAPRLREVEESVEARVDVATDRPDGEPVQAPDTADE